MHEIWTESMGESYMTIGETLNKLYKHAASPIDYLFITIYITIYGIVRVQLVHFSIRDGKDISIADVIIIIKS